MGKMDVDTLINTLTSEQSAAQLTSLVSDVVDLYKNNKALIDVLTKYTAPENNAQLKKLLEFMTDENTVKAVELLSDSSVTKFFAGLSDMGDAMPVANSLLRLPICLTHLRK